ncbi:MAG: hypothetical protein [Bacteriophage sp.]|nr:MAG: hypothetical protein [Bacteriophage sp.]
MCWIGRKDTKQIAKRDFYVYKIGVVLGNTFVSLFQKHIYRIKGSNPIIPLKPIKNDCEIIEIKAGYHSYKEVAIEFYSQNPYFRSIYLGDAIKGFVDEFSLYSHLYLCTFIVPKGSEYYINSRGEIVSSNIIYTGKWVKL